MKWNEWMIVLIRATAFQSRCHSEMALQSKDQTSRLVCGWFYTAVQQVGISDTGKKDACLPACCQTDQSFFNTSCLQQTSTSALQRNEQHFQLKIRRADTVQYKCWTRANFSDRSFCVGRRVQKCASPCHCVLLKLKGRYNKWHVACACQCVASSCQYCDVKVRSSNVHAV